MKKILAIFLLAMPIMANADNWLCIADQSTGFTREQGIWQHAQFVPGEKFLIKPADATTQSVGEIFTDFGEMIYQVHRFGQDFPSYICPRMRRPGGIDRMFICSGLLFGGQTFNYNQKTGHFLATTVYGYVVTQEGKVSDDTPSISIGKCSKL